MEEALPMWRVLGLRSVEAYALFNLARIAYETGDAATSAQRAEDALTIFRAVENPTGIASALEVIATLAWDRGDDRAAVLAYQEGLRLWVRVDTRWSAASGHGAGSDPGLFPRWAGFADRSFLSLTLSRLAAIAADYAQGELAAHLLGAVDRRWDDSVIGIAPRAVGKHEATRAKVRATLGERSFAVAYAAGEQLRLSDAVALALTIAVPDPGAATIGAPRLTERQIEVLRHLVQGETDRQIAEALFLSRRTVQDHVSRLIATLGVANRTEAAADAIRDRLV
jgi:DNA-binding CsgD family transcriptional regulator